MYLRENNEQTESAYLVTTVNLIHTKWALHKNSLKIMSFLHENTLLTYELDEPSYFLYRGCCFIFTVFNK